MALLSLTWEHVFWVTQIFYHTVQIHITLSTEVRLIKAMVFPVVMYGL